MDSEPPFDPQLEDVFAAQVERGEFATVESARADLITSLKEAIEEIEAGGGVDIEVFAAELRERYASWPRAAE